MAREGARGPPPAPFRVLPRPLEFAPMADEAPELPTSRLARWIAIAGVIVFAVALYFRDGRRLPPLTNPASPATAQPAP
jgi:hypothetical protein